MAFLSDYTGENALFPIGKKDEEPKCCSCGKTISKGGLWSMNQMELSICEDCAPILLDWYIDTLMDSENLSKDDDIENIKNLSTGIIERYDRKKKKMIKYKKKHI